MLGLTETVHLRESWNRCRLHPHSRNWQNISSVSLFASGRPPSLTVDSQSQFAGIFSYEPPYARANCFANLGAVFFLFFFFACDGPTPARCEITIADGSTITIEFVMRRNNISISAAASPEILLCAAMLLLIHKELGMYTTQACC